MEKDQAKSRINFDLEIIGERIAHLRKRLKLKQKDIAIELNVLPLTINRLERGKGGSIKVLLNYFNFLAGKGVVVEALFAPDFNIQEAFPPKFVTETETKTQVPEQNKNIPEFGKQIQEMISVQKEKTVQSFDDLLHIAKSLTNFYDNK